MIKSGDNKLTSNYRLISLLSLFSKILENIIYNHLTNFFNKHEIFHKHQYGFCEHHSTELAVSDILSTCYKAIQSNQHTCLLTVC